MSIFKGTAAFQLIGMTTILVDNPKKHVGSVARQI